MINCYLIAIWPAEHFLHIVMKKRMISNISTDRVVLQIVVGITSNSLIFINTLLYVVNKM